MKIYLSIFLALLLTSAGYGQMIGISKDTTNVFEYSPVKNQTTVTSPYFVFYAVQGQGFELTQSLTGRFAFVFDGRAAIIAPDQIEFRATSQVNNKWKFESAKSRTLTVIADDQMVATAVMERVRKEKSQTINVTFTRYREDLSVTLPADKLLSVLAAKKVSFQLGGDKLKLADHELEVLRKYLILAKK